MITLIVVQFFFELWNLFFREYVGDYLEPLPADLNLKPFCPEVPTSLLSMDHLVGVRMRDQLQVAPEGGLKEAFQGILHTVKLRAETCAILFRGNFAFQSLDYEHATLFLLCTKHFCLLR